jgi:hypothetical protein
MNTQEALDFVELIRNSSNPVIRDFLENAEKLAGEAFLRALAEKSAA